MQKLPKFVVKADKAFVDKYCSVKLETRKIKMFANTIKIAALVFYLDKNWAIFGL